MGPFRFPDGAGHRNLCREDSFYETKCIDIILSVKDVNKKFSGVLALNNVFMETSMTLVILSIPGRN